MFRFVRLTLLGLLGFSVRVILYHDFPIFLTNDSWDYIKAASDIFHHLNFYGDSLRDVRLPGYPVLLAILYPLTKMHSERIVLFQTVIGLSSVGLGYLIGQWLDAWLAAEGLVLFLGLNPIYLLNEHALMTENFFLLVLLGFTLAVVVSLSQEVDWPKGVLLGLSASLCVLIRANALLFCVVLVIGVIVIRILQGKMTLPAATVKYRFYRFLFALLLTPMLVNAPWLWRNYVLFGNLSLVNFNNRNILIYQSMHYPLDPSLPFMKQVNATLGMNEVNYNWLWKLTRTYPTKIAEKTARDLIEEQIRYYPGRYFKAIIRSFIGFGGVYGRLHDERSALLDWFTFGVSQVNALHKANMLPNAKLYYPDFTYRANGRDTIFTHLWSRIGKIFLVFVRPVLFLLFLTLSALYFFYHRVTSFQRVDSQTQMILLCSIGYIITAIQHSITLTDSDRYTTPFDWIPLLVILLIIGKFLKQRKFALENNSAQVKRSAWAELL